MKNHWWSAGKLPVYRTVDGDELVIQHKISASNETCAVDGWVSARREDFDGFGQSATIISYTSLVL